MATGNFYTLTCEFVHCLRNASALRITFERFIGLMTSYVIEAGSKNHSEMKVILNSFGRTIDDFILDSGVVYKFSYK